MSTYEKASLLLETLVVFILIAEFIYDAAWNTRENRIKRRKKNEKAKDIGNKAQISNTPNLEQKQGTPGNP